MIAPDPVNFEVLPRPADFLKAQPLQQCTAARIVGKAGGRYPIETLVLKHVLTPCADNFLHQALSLRLFGNGIAKVTALGDAALNIGEITDPDQGACDVVARDEA